LASMLRRFIGRRRVLADGELTSLGPHWHELHPLYRDLEKLEDLAIAVGGAVCLQHDRRFSLLNALNSLERVLHHQHVDLDASDVDQKNDGADASYEQRPDPAEPPSPQEAASSSATLQQQQQQKPHHRHQYYFVDAGDQGNSIAAASVQAIFDEVI